LRLNIKEKEVLKKMKKGKRLFEEKLITVEQIKDLCPVCESKSVRTKLIGEEIVLECSECNFKMGGF